MSSPQHPFRSARLIYRRITSPQDDEYFKALQTDAESADLSTASVLAPISDTQAQRTLEGYRDSYLGVMICLPTTDENLASAGHAFKKEDLLKPSLIRDEMIDSGIPIGAMCLDRPASMSRIHYAKGTIGVDIAPRHQGKGYGREALNWLLDWGFTHAAFHRIQIRCFGWNKRAIHLYQSLGFKMESCERESLWHEGRWEDDYGLAMLDWEWRELRGIKDVPPVREQVKSS